MLSVLILVKSIIVLAGFIWHKKAASIEAAFLCLLNYLFSANCNSRLRCNCAKKLSAIGLNLANSSRGKGSDLGSLTVLGLRCTPLTKNS